MKEKEDNFGEKNERVGREKFHELGIVTVMNKTNMWALQLLS